MSYFSDYFFDSNTCTTPTSNYISPFEAERCDQNGVMLPESTATFTYQMNYSITGPTNYIADLASNFCYGKDFGDPIGNVFMSIEPPQNLPKPFKFDFENNAPKLSQESSDSSFLESLISGNSIRPQTLEKEDPVLRFRGEVENRKRKNKIQDKKWRNSLHMCNLALKSIIAEEGDESKRKFSKMRVLQEAVEQLKFLQNSITNLNMLGLSDENLDHVKEEYLKLRKEAKIGDYFTLNIKDNS